MSILCLSTSALFKFRREKGYQKDLAAKLMV